MKALTRINPEGYHFQCIWDEAVDIEKVIDEARKHCGDSNVLYYHSPNARFAIVFGGNTYDESNKGGVECVHSYLLDHEWTLEPPEDSAGSSASITDFCIEAPLPGKKPSGGRIRTAQLSNWIEAKTRYFERVKPELEPLATDLIQIVCNLGSSLLHFLARNFVAEGITPDLLHFVDREHHYSGFDLETENPKLYSYLLKLNGYCNNIVQAISLDKLLVEQFLQTTKEIWLWYSHHKYRNNIPMDQLREFTENYRSL